ncbi:hypothetical protein E2542_SST13620 [Spatholobus suberectus]|nr:hypothetical protein E2542_SST13620 [Spatholobus suberectus]
MSASEDSQNYSQEYRDGSDSNDDSPLCSKSPIPVKTDDEIFQPFCTYEGSFYLNPSVVDIKDEMVFLNHYLHSLDYPLPVMANWFSFNQFPTTIATWPHGNPNYFSWLSRVSKSKGDLWKIWGTPSGVQFDKSKCSFSNFIRAKANTLGVVANEERHAFLLYWICRGPKQLGLRKVTTKRRGSFQLVKSGSRQLRGAEEPLSKTQKAIAATSSKVPPLVALEPIQPKLVVDPAEQAEAARDVATSLPDLADMVVDFAVET